MVHRVNIVVTSAFFHWIAAPLVQIVHIESKIIPVSEETKKAWSKQD